MELDSENTPGVGFIRRKTQGWYLENTPEVDSDNKPGVGFIKYTRSGIYKIQQKWDFKNTP